MSRADNFLTNGDITEIDVLATANPVILCRALLQLSDLKSSSILKLIKHPDPEVRRHLCKFLAKSKHKNVVSFIGRLFEDESMLVRCEALKATVQYKTKSSYELIQKAIEDKDLAVKCTAIRCAGLNPDATLLPLLIKCALHPESMGMSECALNSLKIYGDSAVKYLANLYGNSKENEQSNILRLACHIGTLDAEKLIIRGLYGSVKDLSINLLGKMKSKLAVPELTLIMRERQIKGENIFGIAKALVDIGDNTLVHKAVHYLTDAGKYHCGWHRVGALAELMGILGDSSVLPELESTQARILNREFSDETNKEIPRWMKTFGLKKVRGAIELIRKTQLIDINIKDRIEYFECLGHVNTILFSSSYPDFSEVERVLNRIMEPAFLEEFDKMPIWVKKYGLENVKMTGEIVCRVEMECNRSES